MLDLFYECAYEIGWNLMDLGKLEEAVCYLEIASKNLNAPYVTEYINGLVNLQDSRSLGVIDYAFSHFSDPKYGEWFGYLRRDGKPTEPPCKGHTYKGPFHVMRMLSKCLVMWGE